MGHILPFFHSRTVKWNPYASYIWQMGFSLHNSGVLLSVLLAGGIHAAGATEIKSGTTGNPSGSGLKGTLLLLHYRWRSDFSHPTEMQPCPAAIKKSRLSAPQRAARDSWQDQWPRSGFSFELFDADRKHVSTSFLEDPGVLRMGLE